MLNKKTVLGGILLFFLATLLDSRPPRQEVDILDVFLAGRGGSSQIVSDNNLSGTVEEGATLYPIVEAKVGDSTYYFSKADTVEIAGKKISTRPYPTNFEQLKISWFGIEPVPDWYSSVGGLGNVVYQEKPSGNGWIKKINHPGTERFKVVASNDHEKVSSPGKEGVKLGGFLPEVKPVVTLRENKGNGDNVDYMTEHLGTAYILGSTPKQISGHIGTDCQTLVKEGLRKSEKVDLSDNAHIHETQNNHKIYEGYFGLDGKTYDPKGRQKDCKIQRGDIIHFPKSSGRISGHYMAVYQDCSGFLNNKPNGRLDLSDRIIHNLKKTHINRVVNVWSPRQRFEVYRF